MDVPDISELKYFHKKIEKSVDVVLKKFSYFDLQNADCHSIVKELMKSNDVKNLADGIVKNYDLSNATCDIENYVVNLESSDVNKCIDVEDIITHLIHNKETNSKTKALLLLLNFPVNELTEPIYWQRLSKILRDYLICRNHDLFSVSFKIHDRLITCPQTLVHGFTNLTKTLMSLFNSKKAYFSYDDGILTNNLVQKNILELVGLLIKSFEKTNKIYKEKIMENFVHDFMELVCFHTYYDKCEYLNVFNYMSVLDPKAHWFHKLIYNNLSRNIVFAFCKKNLSFFRYLVTLLVSSLTSTFNCSENFALTRNEGNINSNVIQFATFSACGYILSYMFQSKQIQDLFPISVKSFDKPVNDFNMVTIIITAVNNFEFVIMQKAKRLVLVNILKNILQKNYHYLSHKEISYLFLRPLHTSAIKKYSPAEIAVENLHIFQICSDVKNWKDGFLIIFGLVANWNSKKGSTRMNRGSSLVDHASISVFVERYLKLQSYHYSARERDQFIPGKIIIEFATSLCQHITNSTQALGKYDNALSSVLKCCSSIYSCHSHVFFMAHTHKFLETLRNLFKTFVNSAPSFKAPLIELLCLMCASYNGFEILKEVEFIESLSKECFAACTVNSDINLFKFINNVSHLPQMRHVLLENNKYIVTPYLNNIWRATEDEHMFLSGSSRKIDEALFFFLRFILQVNFNSKFIASSVSDEAKDDDSTLIDSDKPLNLQDLLLDALNESGPGTFLCYVGLMAAKVMVINLDTLLYLESALRLQEKLENVQMSYQKYCTENLDSTSEIIDECNLLRNYLIFCIKFVSSNDVNLFENFDVKLNQNYRTTRSVPSLRKKPMNAFHRFLNESRNNLHDLGWLIQARKNYKTVTGEILKEHVIIDLIQQVKLLYPHPKINYVWSCSDNSINLHAEEIVGISIVVRYGISNGQLQSCNMNEENLAIVLKQVKCALNLRKNHYVGFDWFVAVIFLLCSGNLERTKSTLQNVLSIPSAPYFWYELGRKLQLEEKQILTHLDNGFNLMIEDLDSLNSALKSTCISWNSLAHTWLKQCFLNSMEWKEICHFISVCMLYPPDYIFFYFHNIARHLERNVFKGIHSNDINSYHKMFDLFGFRLNDHLSSMEHMGKQHKNIISSQ